MGESKNEDPGEISRSARNDTQFQSGGINDNGSSEAIRQGAFRALHEREGAFIIANPWDVGTARLLAHLGFEALATLRPPGMLPSHGTFDPDVYVRSALHDTV